MKVQKESFGFTKDGEEVFLHRLENAGGAYVEVIDYGCRIRGIYVPDKSGKLVNVNLGYETLAEYEKDNAFLGAAIGRHANRIGGAKFTLNGKSYELEKNNGENNLHGGSIGFAYRVWSSQETDSKLMFFREFPDGEDGYPGNLTVKIFYEWSDDCRLMIAYEGTSDQDTVYNVTNHAYFNLGGADHPAVDSALVQELQIFASSFTENDDSGLPTGEVLSVGGQPPFDFRVMKAIGKDIGADNEQLKRGKGYDHNYILDGKGFRDSAVLRSEKSGIQMTCATDQPGLQFYSGNNLDPEVFRGAICLETQLFPNATNIPSFPSVVLRAGESNITKTQYRFEVV